MLDILTLYVTTQPMKRVFDRKIMNVFILDQYDGVYIVYM